MKNSGQSLTGLSQNEAAGLIFTIRSHLNGFGNLSLTNSLETYPINLLAVGAEMLNSTECPFAPTGEFVRVRAEFREKVAAALGETYATSNLGLRRSMQTTNYYAPVSLTPGMVLVYTAPPRKLEDAWVEPTEALDAA